MPKHDNDNKPLKKKHPATDDSLQPDPETLHKTDPQENMKGPVSSFMKKIEEEMETKESREEATKKRNKHM